MRTVSDTYEQMFGSPISEQRQDEIIDMLEDCDDLEDVELLADGDERDDYGLSAGEFNVFSYMLASRCGWQWRNQDARQEL